MSKLKKKPIIIGIGELLWDLLPTGKKAGGAPINFAYHASHMGAESYAISAVGKDLLGDVIMEEIDKIKIGHVIERVNFPTGTVLVELKEGIPNYTIIENVAWDHIPTTMQIEELAKKADAICFGTLAQRSERSRKTIQSVLSFAPEEVYRIFDINIRQNFYSKAIILESLRMCNVFKINEEELILLKELFNKQQSNENDVCNWFVKEFHLKFMILTAGSDYSKIFASETFSHIKTPKVKVVDTVGAGDAFTGVFISSILNGKPLFEAHQEAVERAAFICTKSGAWVTE
jgi:fructokinase